MAGQGRTLLILGGVLVAGIAAVMWLAMSDPAESPAEPGGAPAGTPQEDAAKTSAPAAVRVKKAGTAAVFGEVRRSAGQAPVPNQEVALAPERGEPWTVTTDAVGSFRFDKIPHGGPYELSAAAKGCATIRIPGIALDRGEQRNVGTLILDPSVKLTVLVRTSADQPVEGAVVEAFAIPQVVNWDWSKALAQLSQPPISVARTATGAKGEAVFPEMAVGVWTFRATKAGFAPGAARRVSLRSEQEPRPVTIYVAPGHPLDGHVLGPDKKPVAGAVVTAATPNSEWDFGSAPLRARTTADAEGRYAFAALESGELQLWVARPGGVTSAVATVRVPLVPHFEIVLKGTGVISGTVTQQEDGKPAEGATVRATSWESGTTRTGESVADAEGRYSLEMTAGAINRINVEKPGCVEVRDDSQAQRQRVAVLREGETFVKNLAVRRGARLTGVVKGPEGPLAGARVTVSIGRPNEGFSQKSGTTDAAGRYEFPALDKGTVLVLATKEGHYLPGAPDNWWEALQSADAAKDLKVEVPETGEAAKDLEMRRGSVVEGVVLGPDGAPLPGVRVSAPSATEASPTGADGAFRLSGVKPGPAVRLHPAKDGYSAGSNQPVVVAEDQPTGGLTLRMMREARVRGTVSTVSGAAPLETRVLLATRNKASQTNPWEENSRWQNAVRAPVRPDGTYDAPLPAGGSGVQLIVRAVSLDHAQTDAKPVDVVEGQETYLVDLVLTPGADLTGNVVAKAGAAGIAGAHVSLSPTRGDGEMRYGSSGIYPVWAVTDAAGAFTIPHLAPGRFDVRAGAAGFVAGLVTATVGDGKSVTIELPPELTIEGIAAFGDGRPAEGVEIQASSAVPQTRSFGGMHENQPTATTDAKGFFRLTGVAEGTYSLSVQAPWGTDVNIRPQRVDAVTAGTANVKITVEAGGSISGRVSDAKGRPVATAYISAGPVPKAGVAMTGHEWRHAQTRPDGTFTLTGLGEGPYNLSVSSNTGSGGGHRPVQVENVAAGTKDVAVVLEEGLSISGVVSDPDGRPIVQMAIQAQPADPQGGRASAMSAWTDSEGKFTVAGLAPGPYRLEVAQWGGQNQGWMLDSRETYAAGAKDLRLTAGKGVTIAGVLVDETGAPVTQGWVSAAGKKGGGGGRYGQPKGDGSFEISGLETGQTYTLHAQSQGRVGVQVEDVAAGAKDVRIVLAKGLEASGHLLDAAGKAMASASISFTHPDGKHNQWVQTGADGRFTVGGLVEGTYEAKVYVQKADGKGGDWAVVGSIRPGDRDTELRMPQ